MWLRIRRAARHLRRLLAGELDDLAERARGDADRAHERITALEKRLWYVEHEVTRQAAEDARFHQESETHGYLIAALTEELVHHRGESQRQAVYGRVIDFVNARARLAQHERESQMRAAVLARAQERPVEAAPAPQEPSAEPH